MNPSEGMALAAAAISIRYTEAPEVVLASEPGILDILRAKTVIVIDYLVAVLNKSRIDPVVDFVDSLVEAGCKVVGYSPWPKRREVSAVGDSMARLVSCAIAPVRQLRGYSCVVNALRCCDRPTGESSRQLAEEATALDFAGERGRHALLNYQTLPTFGTLPDVFRSFVTAVVAVA